MTGNPPSLNYKQTHLSAGCKYFYLNLIKAASHFTCETAFSDSPLIILVLLLIPVILS